MAIAQRRQFFPSLNKQAHDQTHSYYVSPTINHSIISEWEQLADFCLLISGRRRYKVAAMRHPIISSSPHESVPPRVHFLRLETVNVFPLWHQQWLLYYVSFGEVICNSPSLADDAVVSSAAAVGHLGLSVSPCPRVLFLFTFPPQNIE